MNKDPLFDHWLEVSWRRKLTAAEEAELRAWLQAHPEAQADWDAERQINAALARLPDVPLASNFTSRVLHSIELASAADSRASGAAFPFRARLLRWWPRAGLAAAIMGAGLFSYHHIRLSERMALVQSVSAVSDVSSLPGPEILRDFDTIRALSQTPPADEQLLTLLQ
jgi:hypothetical protein